MYLNSSLGTVDFYPFLFLPWIFYDTLKKWHHLPTLVSNDDGRHNQIILTTSATIPDVVKEQHSLYPGTTSLLGSEDFSPLLSISKLFKKEDKVHQSIRANTFVQLSEILLHSV